MFSIQVEGQEGSCTALGCIPMCWSVEQRWHTLWKLLLALLAVGKGLRWWQGRKGWVFAEYFHTIVACSEQAGHSEPWRFFAVSSCALLPLVARKLISTGWVVVIFFFSFFPELRNFKCKLQGSYIFSLFGGLMGWRQGLWKQFNNFTFYTV